MVIIIARLTNSIRGPKKTTNSKTEVFLEISYRAEEDFIFVKKKNTSEQVLPHSLNYGDLTWFDGQVTDCHYQCE